jgi:hypothetical protein
MKKVRAVGLVGVAPAVVGLAIPVAHGAPAVTQSPRNGAKTVSLIRTDRSEAPLVTCGYGRITDKTSTRGYLETQISYSKRCIGGQEAYLFKRQAGLTERIRFYSANGAREASYLRGGTIHVSSTYFVSFPNIYAYEVCAALVANGNHSDVEYGPVCQDATSG